MPPSTPPPSHDIIMTNTTTNCASCGYVAAILAAICLGTMGVPIKSDVVVRHDVDVLVMQSYKTTMAFLTTCLFAILSSNYHHTIYATTTTPIIQLQFTHWGILSGLFSVPGGLASVYAIRHAGLAIAVGIYSSTVVLTSFVWGVFVFDETVKSINGACCAIFVLIMGLLGMSSYSDSTRYGIDKRHIRPGGIEMTSSSSIGRTGTVIAMAAFDEEYDVVDGVRKRRAGTTATRDVDDPGDDEDDENDNETTSSRSISPLLPLEMEYRLLGGKDGAVVDAMPIDDDGKSTTTMAFSLFGYRILLTMRQSGILASVVGGAWGGMNLVPLHFAALEGCGGPSYVISFFGGCMVVIIALWTMRFLRELYRHDYKFGRAYAVLPSFHLRLIWFQGCLSGVLLCLGKFMTIIAVTHLGNSVGNCFAQGSMLVSGLWGIFRFREIEGRERIMKWLSSACFALMGIMWLSYEHAS